MYAGYIHLILNIYLNTLNEKANSGIRDSKTTKIQQDYVIHERSLIITTLLGKEKI